MFITTREVRAKAKTGKSAMQRAVQGVRAQQRYGSTPQEAIDYIRVNLNLTHPEVAVLTSKILL